MKVSRKASLWVLAGFLMMAMLLLTAANGLNQPQVGRYRMAVTTRSNFTDIYVIDTATGIVKYLGKNEGMPFEKIKGK